MTVVGVVERIGIVGRPGRDFLVIAPRHPPSIFVPARQWTALPEGWRPNADCEECLGVSLAVRAAGDPSAAGIVLRAALSTAAPDLPLNFLGTVYEQQLHSWTANRINPPGRLVAAGSIVGLLLALLGIVGVVADGVARRTREIGVRVALGARAHQVLSAVARESVTTGLVGLGAGLVLLVALHHVIPRLLVDRQIRSITPSLLDPGLLALAAGVVLILVLTAALATARRALRIDPAEALRSE